MPVTRSPAPPAVVIPAHNYELERGVLGAAFYQPHLTQAVAAADNHLFWPEEHRDIHKALRELLPSLNGRVPQPAEVLAQAAALGLRVEHATLVEIESAGASAIDVAVPLGQLAELAAQREEMAILTNSQGAHLAPEKKQREVMAALRDRLHRADELRDQAAKVQPTMVLTRTGDMLTFGWDSLGAKVTLDVPRSGSEGLSAEISVYYHARLIHWARLNLSTGTTRGQLAKALREMAPRVDWRPLLELVCLEGTKIIRAGNPLVELVPTDTLPSDDEVYLVQPVLPRGDTTVFFGDGGACKGYLSLVTALTYITGRALVHGLVPSAHAPVGNVLCLDWETQESDHQHRLGGLMRGLNIKHSEVQGRIYYRRLESSLADQAAVLRTMIAQHNIALVIVDSMGPASGTDPETANAAITTLNALRSFGPIVTKIVIAHVSKVMADSRFKARPFGSVFIQNLPRATWEVVLSGGDDGDAGTPNPYKNVGCFNRKSNNGIQPSFALTFHFDKAGNRIAVTSGAVAHVPGLVGKTSYQSQVREYLKNHGPSTRKEIVSGIAGLTPDQVTTACNELKGKNPPQVVLVDGRWALTAHQQEHEEPAHEPGADWGEEFQGGQHG